MVLPKILLMQSPLLICYVEHGSLLINNNPVEKSMLPIAMGKNNCLFAGSERKAVGLLPFKV